MASLYCPVCTQTVVRHAGDICSRCRAAGHVSIRDTRLEPIDEKLMGQLEPRILVEAQLRQFRTMQARLERVIAGAGEDASTAYRGDVVSEMLKISRGLQALVGEWRQLQKDAKEAAEQLGQEEMVAVVEQWFPQLPSTVQRELLQSLQRVHNERRVG